MNFIGTVSGPWRGILGSQHVLPWSCAVLGNGAGLFQISVASNPVVVSCPVGEWKKVASGVTGARIHKMMFGAAYLHTYRLVNDPAPIGLATAVQWFKPTLLVAHGAAIDVYL